MFLQVCSEVTTTRHPIASHLEEETLIRTVEHLFLVETHLLPISQIFYIFQF